MSLFDLQDVCIAIGSLATLDLPMVVDLIGIYVLKGPYCTLTTTNWFLKALSVIPRGSWGDVARRFTMIRWANRSDQIIDRSYDEVTPPSWPPPLPIHNTSRPPPLRRRAAPPAAASRDRTCSNHLVEGILFVSNSSALLVQTDEGVLIPVVDRIKEIYRRLP
ncbi:sphingoid long-chain bases kinase 2, mitochondrial [Dorcoceras hygrometricum]|uniref:Sphingoid long-chain bases kinase 2, mitochondrial n=1 Tax=Dorcoceras hygrometricum TaxID=472368 RepID=A0A2Z7BYU9_9LAMI|nr:sphingoid long-chain bases kinase 2, mitochondrial [Dorcoceras hygrometricum]